MAQLRGAMDLQQLATFCAVVSEGSMTAAAARLSITQPAVSQQIRQLELELGVKILMRGVRQVCLTVQGQLLYNYARQMLQLTQKVQAAIQTLSNDMEGKIRVTTLSSIGLHMITPMIGTILNPGQRKLQMELSYGSGLDIIQQMKNAQVDIAILPNLQEEYGIELPDYESKFLFKDDLLFVGSGKDSSMPRQLSIQKINMHPIVSFKNLFPKFQHRFNQTLKEHRVSATPVFESNNIGTLKKIIETWMCWGFLPAHSIRKQIHLGRLTAIQLEEINYSMNIHVYYQKNQDAKKKKIIDTFLMMFQKQPIANME